MRVRARITDPAAGSVLGTGTYTVRGKAWSGSAPITRVEISLTGEGDWQPAQVEPARGGFHWQDWTFSWDAPRSADTLFEPGRPTLPATCNPTSPRGTASAMETMPSKSSTWIAGDVSTTFRQRAALLPLPGAGGHDVSLDGTPGVLVIGGGPGGLAAALEARELGADVTLLEAEQVGGTSLNRGPAPVRTLARSARLARDWNSWQQFGLRGARPTVDLAAVLTNSARVAQHAHDNKDLAGLLRNVGIDLVEQAGSVRFVDPHTVRAADGRTWRGDRIILAVGGHPAPLPVPGGDLALSYSDLRKTAALPQDVIVIGGADTGCQIASIFADFGVRVQLIEFTPSLLPAADPSVSEALTKAFEARGIRVSTRTQVTELQAAGGQTIVRLTRDGQHGRAEADAVFAAVGWPASLDQLDLTAAGVGGDASAIPVDEYLRSNVSHIFAVGDAIGRTRLVQTARAEGRIAAWNAIQGPDRKPSYGVVPSGSFTDPEYGAVGLTEPQAARDHDICVGLARYDELVRPVADGHADGFCKLIVDRSTHRVLGAHVLGEYSAETVQVRGHGHGCRHECRGPGRHAVRVSHLHRSGQHGRPAGLPSDQRRAHSALVALPPLGGITSAAGMTG